LNVEDISFLSYNFYLCNAVLKHILSTKKYCSIIIAQNFSKRLNFIQQDNLNKQDNFKKY